MTSVGVSFPAVGNDGKNAQVEGGKSKWYKKASGRLKNIYPEFDLLFASTKVGWNIVKSMVSSMLRPFSTINTFDASRSGFAVNTNSKNVKKISDDMLKQKGINAHDVKHDILGKKAIVSHYDLYKDTGTGEILMFKKGGKGESIPTGIYIK